MAPVLRQGKTDGKVATSSVATKPKTTSPNKPAKSTKASTGKPAGIVKPAAKPEAKSPKVGKGKGTPKPTLKEAKGSAWHAERKRQATEAKKAETRAWLHWPPYTYVRDIPAGILEDYKQLFRDILARAADKKVLGIEGAAAVRVRVAGDSIPVLKDEATNRILAWRAKYRVEQSLADPRNWKAWCIEPGWKGLHSSGGGIAVEFRFPESHVPASEMKMFREKKEIYLGFVLHNRK
ncbi:hypothetical protein LTR36_001656 [Oleoguttula mirabilis]|uniref:Uncharacterized protein n=1 Tax=Oleoguttula mirabilis TaxID=1507867 RepID=A0AAV9JNG7_9PEZI|nr:hypothetical protein LTR36_001656 [Oleoguttula mirabilis]